MVYSDYGQVPVVSSLQIIRSNFFSIFRLPDTCSVHYPLLLHPQDKPTLVEQHCTAATLNRIPAFREPHYKRESRRNKGNPHLRCQVTGILLCLYRGGGCYQQTLEVKGTFGCILCTRIAVHTMISCHSQ
jgi:hypothetical protein